MNTKSLLFSLFIGLSSTAQLARAQENEQVINNQTGGIFMEEVTPPSPPSRKRKVNIDLSDLSNVGVPTDSAGRIVPLINRDSGPIMTQGSQLQVYNEPAWNFLPPAVVNPYGQMLNIYGQPVNAWGQQINQFGQPMNTWARLGIPGMGITPPQGMYPTPYFPTYPAWNSGTNIGLNFGRNLGMSLNIPTNNYPWQSYSPLYSSPWRQWQNSSVTTPLFGSTVINGY